MQYANASFHHIIAPSTLPSASVPPRSSSASTATTEPQGVSSQASQPGTIQPPSSLPTNLSFPLPFPFPLPTLPHHPNVFFFSHRASNFSLATAAPPVQPTSSLLRPSPVSPTLRQQILSGNYADLTRLLQPSIIDTSQPRAMPTHLGPVQLTRKYSGKKRLIIDLSSPHGSQVPSI